MFFFETVYVKTALPQDIFQAVLAAVATPGAFGPGGTLHTAETGQLDPIRQSQVRWFRSDVAAVKMLADFVSLTNELAGWRFDVTGLSAVQHSRYAEGGFYDWHRDEHDWRPGKWGAAQPGMRKLSFSLGLNAGYQGGQLELEVVDPSAGTRSDVIELAPGELLVFHSDTLHRVRPVTAGVRESLVGWMMGPPFV